MSPQIAILGAGVIGETLLASILESGHPADRIAISEKSPVRSADLRSKYGVTVAGGDEVVRDAEIVLIAVKPADVGPLLAQVAAHVRPDATVVSLAAGVTIASIEDALADGVAVIRAMPNTPVLVREGMFGVSPGSHCRSEQLDRVLDILRVGGKVMVVEEAEQDALTAVSGSGPAYVFYLAEAMIAGGVSAGLSEEAASALTIQTMIGAAKLLGQSGESASELRRRVTSPGGTTAAAIEVFDRAGVMAAVTAGVEAARLTSKELATS